MYSINLRWEPTITEIDDLVGAGYDLWSIDRQDPGPVWTSIAPSTVVPMLVSDMTSYVFQSATTVVSPLPTMRARAYRSSDGAFSATAFDITVSFAGYCSIQDIRGQGWADSVYPDADVLKAISYATNLIDKITRQWFEPRFRHVSMDGRNLDQLFLNVPIISIMQIEIDETKQDNTGFLVYNRHMTHGIVSPDDKADPRVTWSEGRNGLDIRRLYGGGRFMQARKSIRLSGIYGYTEHGPGDYAGETVKGNQLPISYGSTPLPIKNAALRLVLRHMQPLEEGDDVAKAGRVVEEKTRDQSYKLGTPSSVDSSFGITGDIEVDKILMMYPAPLDIGVTL